MAYLSGPVHSLADFQLEYAGLLMGAGTAYDLPPTWTFFDSAPVKSMEQQRPWGDGSWAGPDFADVATWQVPVEVVAAGGVTFPAAIAALMQACSISKASRPLWVKVPGFEARGIRARTAQRSLPMDLGWGQYTLGAVQWRAPYPVWQSLPRQLTLKPSTGTAGLDFPLFTAYGGSSSPVLDYGLATAAAYAGIVTNAGNVDAPPVAVVTGPTNGWQLTLDGHIVASSMVLGAQDVVTVDYASGRAQLSSFGSAPVDRTTQLSGRDFAPVPAGGISTVTFAGTGGSAAFTTADLWR
jgi:hypothetical protein